MSKFSTRTAGAVLSLCVSLAGCGGGGGASSAAATASPTAAASPDAAAGAATSSAANGASAADATSAAGSSNSLADASATAVAALTYYDAWRLADQATFGPSESLVASIKAQGAAPWISTQMTLRQSRYTSGGTAAVHQYTSSGGFCDAPANGGSNCWRDNYVVDTAGMGLL